MKQWTLAEETWHSEILDGDRILIRTDLTKQYATQDEVRLMATAPEMLESLKEVLSCIDQQTDDPVLGPIIETAKSVIKKARGE